MIPSLPIRSDRTEAGFTLIELMVALVIASATTAAAYSLFIAQTRGMKSSQDTMEMQDNARVAMDVLVRDIRNAGFLSPQSSAIRIENDCGRSTNKIDYDAAAVPKWTVEGAASGTAILAGDFVKTSEADACPNGSDRLTVTMRPRSDPASSCSPGGCLNKSSGAGTVFNVPCDVAGCDATAAKIDARGSISCNGASAVTYSPAVPASLCSLDDPTLCLSALVAGSTCNQSCPVDDAAAGATANCIVLTLQNSAGTSLGTTDWAKVGTDLNNVGINAFITRSYQLLPNAEGSTDLVYSDKASDLILSGAAASAEWTAVANNIDDLQFAYSKKTTRTTFANTVSIWNTPDGCTAVAGSIDCLKALLPKPSPDNPPVFVRVSVLARAGKRDLSITSERLTQAYRTVLEDNNPAGVAFLPAGPIPAGCGPSTKSYMSCTQNGNAQGYRRRVVSEVVALRNLVSLAF